MLWLIADDGGSSECVVVDVGMAGNMVGGVGALVGAAAGDCIGAGYGPEYVWGCPCDVNRLHDISSHVMCILLIYIHEYEHVLLQHEVELH